MKIFAGSGGRHLIPGIVESLQVLGCGYTFSELHIEHFPDGEIEVEVMEHVRGEDCFVIQSTYRPVNERLMELAIIVDALKRSDAGRIIGVMPYYGYSRSDRRQDFRRTSITSRLVADILSAAGVTGIVTVDIHSLQQQGYFSCSYVDISSHIVLREHLGDRMVDMTFVSPDLGAVKRTRNVAMSIGNSRPIVVIDKRRSGAGESEVMNIIGDIEGRECLLVDDMIDSGGTICGAAGALKSSGALSVSAFATHGVFSGDAYRRIGWSELDRVIVTDTIPIESGWSKISVISVSHLLACTIMRISMNESISGLYEER